MLKLQLVRGLAVLMLNARDFGDARDVFQKMVWFLKISYHFLVLQWSTAYLNGVPDFVWLSGQSMDMGIPGLHLGPTEPNNPHIDSVLSYFVLPSGLLLVDYRDSWLEFGLNSWPGHFICEFALF